MVISKLFTKSLGLSLFTICLSFFDRRKQLCACGHKLLVRKGPIVTFNSTVITMAFTVILALCCYFLLLLWFCITAVKIGILCVISAFEWSLMYMRKLCCGRETTLCHCKIQFVSKFTATLHGSPCDGTALVVLVFAMAYKTFLCLVIFIYMYWILAESDMAVS